MFNLTHKHRFYTRDSQRRKQARRRMLVENLEPRTVYTVDNLSQYIPSPISSEIRVNQNVVGEQRVWDEASAVVTHADGSFVVSFSGNGSNDYDGVFVRRFNKDGVAIGNDIPVNTTKPGSQNTPSIATNASRSFIVAWTGKGTNDSNGIYFRRFKSDGTPLAPEQMANVSTWGDQVSPSIGIAGDGSFVIAWQGKGASDSNGIFLRRFNADGTAASNEIRVNTTTRGDQRQPQIAMAADGRFAVAWYGKGAADEVGVYLQRYDKTGRALGTEVRVNQTVTGPQTSPAIGINSDGRILIAWEGQGAGDNGGIYFRHVLPDGAFAGNEARANTITKNKQFAPAVSLASDSSFVVVWASHKNSDHDDDDDHGDDDDDDHGDDDHDHDDHGDDDHDHDDDDHSSDVDVFMQYFNAKGAKQGSELLVNTTTVGAQSNPSVSINAARQFTIVWSGKGASDTQGVFARKFEVNAIPIITTIPRRTVHELTPLTIQVRAKDADLPRDLLKYTFDLAPEGATINSDTGLLNWTPSEAQGPGVFEFVVRVTDKKGAFDTESFFVGVLEDNRPPVLEPMADKQLEIGQKYSFTAVASDPDIPANTLRFSFLPGAPAGATINAKTGVFNWTVPPNTAGGKYPITVLVTDNGRIRLSDSKTFTITVGSCTFDATLSGWTIIESGGSGNGKGAVTAQSCSAIIQEGDSFVVGVEKTFVVPATPSALHLRFDDLSFDTNSVGFIRDAFEIALVDKDGNSLVKTHVPGRDSLFNATEGLEAKFDSGIEFGNGSIAIGLNGLPVGTEAKLVVRFANNDSDTTSRIKISDVRLIPSDLQVTLPGGASSQAALSTLGLPFPKDPTSNNNQNAQSLPTLPQATIPFLPNVSSNTNSGGGDPRVLFPSNLELTDAAKTRGFTISTFASGFPTLSGIGPLGIGFPQSGGVIVSDFTGRVWRFPNDADGQNVANLTPAVTFGGNSTIGIERANGRIYLVRRDAGSLVELNNDGTIARTIVTGLGGAATGIATNPIADANGHQHLFVSDLGSGVIWDIDPINATKQVFISARFDGLSTDGKILYGATSDRILGFDLITKALAFDSGAIPGSPDGTALGIGALTGKIYVNTNSAGVWEVDLATKVKTQIAGGPNASRGDFVTVAPDGTLLITQRDQIARLIPPAGSGFGNFELGINATSPLRSVPVGTSLLINGDAYSKRLSDGVSQPIVAVTVNGVAVDALEVSGKFFAQVKVAAGVNSYVLTAVDLSGNTVSTELKIEGVISQSSFDLVQFADITSSLKGLYFRTSFNEGAKDLLVNLATRNDGSFDIQTPLLVGVKNISDPSVSLIGVDGLFANGTPFYNYSPQVDGARLKPNESTAAPTIGFHNPNRVQFTYELVFLGQQNTPPQITSIPIIEAVTGKQYVYSVTASDADNDTLKFTLTEAPVGVEISEATGKITWTPSATQVGNHKVAVQVDDGREGRAIQTYTISLTAAPPNRPPVITSQPVTLVYATVLEETAPITYESEWKYKVVNFTELAGFESPAFDDSSFQTGKGGFGSGGSCLLNQTARNTNWPTFTDILLRREIDLPEGAQQLKVFGAIDNDIQIFLNGIEISQGLQTTEGCAERNEFSVIAPASAIRVGKNVVAIRARDRGSESYVDARITVLTPVRNTTTSPGVRFQYSYDVNSFDADNDVLTHSVIQGPTGLTINSVTGLVSWIPTTSQIGNHLVKIQVDDGRGGIAMQEYTICVESDPSSTPPIVVPNFLPILTSEFPARAINGKPISVELFSQDADADFVTIKLGAGSVGSLIETSTVLPIGAPGPKHYRFEWTPNAADVGAGKRTVFLEANDGRGGISTQTIEIPVLATAPNSVPSILSKPRTTTYPGTPYAYQVLAEDSDANPLQFSLTKGPAGMTISAQGLLQWSSSTLLAALQDVEVAVSDGQGGSATQKFRIQVASQLENTRPAIVSNPKLSAREDRLYAYDAAADDAQGDPVVWSLVRGPIGMSMDANNGRVRWIPRNEQLGSNTVTIRATDMLGAFSEQSFAVDVACVNTPPLILSSPITQAYVGELYVYGVRGVDPDGDPEGNPVRYRTVSAPAGMTISEKGLIRWTPIATDAGKTQRVVVEVSDIDGAIVQQTFDIVVQGSTNRNRPPVITSIPTTSVTTGVPYSYTLIASDPDNEAITFSLSTKPLGMTINETTGVVSWTPGAVGLESVVVEARDARGAIATQGFSINVRDNRAPVVNSVPLTTALSGSTYRYAVSAVDPDGDTLTYVLLDGPQGSVMDGQGRITWNVPGDFSKNGPAQAPVSIAVRDSRGAEAKQDFAITVSADTVAPQVLLEFRGGSSLFSNSVSVDLGASVVVRVLATDNVGVSDLTLDVDGIAVPLNAAGEATISTTVIGTINLRGRATDLAGNFGEKLGSINVVNSGAGQQPPTNDPTLPVNPGPAPGDVNAPLVSITSPAIGSSVANMVPIIGTIDDPENHLWYWRVYYARIDLIDVNSIDLSDSDLVQIGQGTNEIIAGEIAKFDPTKLDNDSYAILVAAYDVNGLGYVAETVVNVEGNAKLGQFKLDFTDLDIPLAGTPIQVTRTYDTRQAGREGDFGFGWSLGVQDARILEVAANGPAGALGNGERTFVADKTKVYLTNPAGQRVGFTYKETYSSGSSFILGCAFGCFYTPTFVPDPGVYDTLTIDETSVSRGGILGALVGGLNPSKYTLTAKDGTQYRYDQSAGLERITDRNGQSVTFTESGIKHSLGTEIRFVRDNRGRIKEVVDPDGNKILYEYDAAGDLKKVTNQAGIKSTYNYLAKPTHYLDEGFDDLGKRDFKVTYDAEGRFKEVIDALGNSIGKQNYDELASRRGTILDANGNATQLLYDNRGNILEETDAAGNVTRREYSDLRNPDRETKIIDRRGMVTERVYDAKGNVNVIRELGPQANTLPTPVVTEVTYDANNRVTSIKNASGALTLLTYDARGNVSTITTPLGDKSSFTYDDQGRRKTLTDFKGNTTTLDYDGGCPCGSPHKITNPDGTFQTYEYNQFGQITQEQIFEANGNLTEQKQTFYDDSGRVAREIIGTGQDTLHPPTEVRKFYTGNLVDWEIIVSPESVNTDGSLKESPATPIAQRKSRITDFEYDDAKRLVKQTDALGGAVNFRYDAQGNRVLLQDPNGNITTWSYNTLNQMSEERDPLYWVSFVNANSSLSNNALLDAVVAENKKPSGVSLVNNQGAAHVRAIGYDAEGNLAEIIDRNNRRREFTYSYAGLPLEERGYAANNGSLVETITSTYDAIGNLLSIGNATSNYSYTYDQLNRISSVNNADTNPSTPNVVLNYLYDAQGNLVSTQDNAGVTVESTYNSRNQLAQRKWFDALVSSGSSRDVDNALVNFLYDAAGREKQVSRYSDLTGTTKVASTDYTYDFAGRLNSLAHKDSVDLLLSSYQYGYDFAGVPINEVRDNRNNQSDQSINYAYDLTGQLVDAVFSGQDDEHYQYDAAGNRVSSTVGTVNRSFSIGSANQLLTDGVYRYEYDGEGNQIRKVRLADGQSTVFTWDHKNRLIKAEITTPNTPTETFEFQYDALDRRIVDLKNGSVIRSKVYNFDQSWLEIDASGNTVRHLFADATDRILAVYSASNAIHWELGDNLGTIRMEIDGSGQVTQEFAYDSFGMPTSDKRGSDQSFAFQGREWISALQLYDYRARLYSSSSGRFASQDPLGFAAYDQNLYRFVFNIPTGLTDPFGKTVFGEYGIQARLAAARASIIECLGASALTNIGTAGIYILLTSVVKTPTGPADTYVGKTIQTFEARFYQHTQSGKKIVSTVKIFLSNKLTPQEVRTAEQLVLNAFGGKAELVNKINASSKLFCK